MTTIERPAATEYAPYYAGYVGHVPDTDILAALEAQPSALRAWARAVPADKELFRYAPDKWSPRQVVGHLSDGERVFGYRAFAIGRGDTAALPGYDEGAYMARARFDERMLADLVDEFAHLRAGNLLAMRSFTAEDWRNVGNANGAPISTRALAWIMVGHVRHHLDVLRTRYGLESATGDAAR
jgi:hypothetical protein